MITPQNTSIIPLWLLAAWVMGRTRHMLADGIWTKLKLQQSYKSPEAHNQPSQEQNAAMPQELEDDKHTIGIPSFGNVVNTTLNEC